MGWWGGGPQFFHLLDGFYHGLFGRRVNPMHKTLGNYALNIPLINLLNSLSYVVTV
jgi:hypothetical protein